jgi:hypothetical protein
MGTAVGQAAAGTSPESVRRDHLPDVPAGSVLCQRCGPAAEPGADRAVMADPTAGGRRRG